MRGADADEDTVFSAALAESLQIPCCVVYGSVPKNTGRSPNDAARRARYAFLEETARQFGATHIATGHNADDQAETVLGRVLRGTSVDGLAGIPSRRVLPSGLVIVRPILSQRRTDIEAYCAACGVVPRRDPSNEKDRYARSRLRKRLPELANAFNPQLVAALHRLSVHAATDSAYLNAQADILWNRTAAQIAPNVLRLDAALLSPEHPALRRRVLLHGIHQVSEGVGTEENAATSAWVEALDALLHDVQRGALTLPGRIRAERTPDGLFLRATAPETRTEAAISSVLLPLPGTVFVSWAGISISAYWQEAGEEPAPRERLARAIDMAVPVGTPLVVRSVNKGGRMAPLGMSGRTRLVRDLLADAKIPVAERDSAPAVVRTDTEEILWLIGIAQAESTRVPDDNETSAVLRLSVTNGSQRKLIPVSRILIP